MRIRTGYSFRRAVGHLPDVMSRIKEIGLDFAPISDTCSTFGFVKATAIAKEMGLRPVYGVELAITPSLGEKKPIVDYWTFFAKDNLASIHKLISIATSNPGREPTLTYPQMMTAEGVIKIGGERSLIANIEPQEDLFIGLSPSLPIGLFRACQAAGHKFIATSDNYYPRADDKEFYRITLGKFRSSVQTYPQHILSREEWCRACEGIAPRETLDQAWNQALATAASCQAQLEKATILIPEKPRSLEEMCRDGAAKLGLELNATYEARLQRELLLIKEKDFEDYFYIIADMIAWAKERMIVGPARGSSCGSLVCYLLGITAIDPIPFDLIFERFIDINRKDLPDIDIDFSDERRQMVFDYVSAKYGSERVARLGTVGMFKPRSALKQAAIGLRIPQWMVGKVTDNIIERSSGDSRALQVLEDTLKDTDAGRSMLEKFPEVLIASKMEGHPNNASQHAAGIVMTQDPIVNYVAVDQRTGSAMCDKYDAESLNLLKIDALGLTQLSIFERTLKLCGLPDVSGYLEKIPIDDQAAFDVLNNAHFSGIFQFNGLSLQSLTKQIHCTKIDDMINITALARPGPMASGGANEWVKRRSGRSKVQYPHDLFEPYLKETLGIVAYQEQVLQIGREIGDLSWEDVTALRKAMSKSLGKEYFDKWGDKWKAGAKAKGIPSHVLDKMWDDLCSYGSWAFNKAHAVAYGMVSYWCCWLKAHHPVEFAAATLDAEQDPYRQIQLLRELESEGIGYVAVDPYRSEDRWTIKQEGDKKVLVGPLTMIKGIGPKSVASIMAARKSGEPMKPALMKKLQNAQTAIDNLYPIQHRVNALFKDLSELNITSKPVAVKDVQCGMFANGERVMIIAVPNRISPKDENEPASVAKRGYKFNGPTKALNLFVNDDSDEIFCKIDRFKFERLGRDVIERGRPGKAIYAIKGTVPKTFRMISVEQIRYIGDMEEERTSDDIVSTDNSEKDA